ncbi:MAG TPA: Tellurium resistance protein TerA [Rhodospirillaceae bacterium]|nr:Tellurium resistance protein TerA [Rhodospirillaceae bacterium]
MSRDQLSGDSLAAASRNRAKFSKHGGKGAAGHVQEGMDKESLTLDGGRYQDVITIPEGFNEPLYIGLSWTNVIQIREEGLLNRMMNKMQDIGVDLDLGCLYELHDGQRGALQPFGDLYGDYEKAPFIYHSGDERTGDTAGDDEHIRLNVSQWKRIKKVLIYCYIYKGPERWEEIMPEISLKMGNLEDIKLKLRSYRDDLPICALATLENKDGKVEITQHAEYFRGHPAMDRAFGFGIRWEEGEKS